MERGSSVARPWWGAFPWLGRLAPVSVDYMYFSEEPCSVLTISCQLITLSPETSFPDGGLP